MLVVQSPPESEDIMAQKLKSAVCLWTRGRVQMQVLRREQQVKWSQTHRNYWAHEGFRRCQTGTRTGNSYCHGPADYMTEFGCNLERTVIIDSCIRKSEGTQEETKHAVKPYVTFCPFILWPDRSSSEGELWSFRSQTFTEYIFNPLVRTVSLKRSCNTMDRAVFTKRHTHVRRNVGLFSRVIQVV